MWLFYFAPVPGVPVEDQKNGARPYGWHEGYAHTYEDSRRSYPDAYNKLAGDLRDRAPNEIWVLDLLVIIQRRGELDAVEDILKRNNTSIFEGKSKRRSNKSIDWGRMLVDLAKSWTKKYLATKQAQLIGRKGGRNKGKALRERRLPAGAVERFWYDKTLSEDEAIAAINDAALAGGYDVLWTRSTLRRHFKVRGTATGPRPGRT